MYHSINILMQKIKLNIANRIYPLNVNPSQEEILRKASKQINDMVNEYEKKYAESPGFGCARHQAPPNNTAPRRHRMRQALRSAIPYTKK